MTTGAQSTAPPDLERLSAAQTADIEAARKEMADRWRELCDLDGLPDPAAHEARMRRYERARDRLLRMTGAL